MMKVINILVPIEVVKKLILKYQEINIRRCSLVFFLQILTKTMSAAGANQFPFWNPDLKKKEIQNFSLFSDLKCLSDYIRRV